jgi:glucuronoarabinoxylan endo-1,4-beta-xylanase
MRKQRTVNMQRGSRYITAILLLLPVFFKGITHAQSPSVNGKVSSTYLPVHNATVTFVNAGDTTKKYIAVTDTGGKYQVTVLTNVRSVENLPKGFALMQNYPNPFLSSTTIGYELSTPSDVQVTIYDILGREVKRFTPGRQQPGVYALQWDAENDVNRRIATGIYFYRLQTKNGVEIRKMVFGMGERGASTSIRLRVPLTKQEDFATPTVVQSSLFTVKIENSDSTFPPITSTQYSNIEVRGDTTIDFTASTSTFSPVIVYADSVLQVIRGFGAANILPWRPDINAGDVATCFGSGPGQIGMTILRLRVPPSSGEFQQNVITAQRALSYGAMIMASPWSPPAAMKNNNNLVGGRLNDSSYGAYALHLKSFVDFMAANNVPLSGISVQNEPDISVTYESCDWTPQEILTFVRDNASVIGTKIIAPESFNFNHTISDPMLNDPLATANLDVVGGHIYGGGLGPYPLAVSKGKEIWMTEHLVLDTTWTDALSTGKEISDCMNAGMSAYIWWYIKRFYGPLGEDGLVTRRGYVMSQFARFVRPGFSRVGAMVIPKGGSAMIIVSAYKQHQQIVIVAINQNTTPVNQTFIVKDGNPISFARYVSTSSKNCIQESDVVVQTSYFTADLEPSSITTFVSHEF